MAMSGILMEEFYHTMHEDLIEEYMKKHPSATLESAIEVTANEAWQCCVSETDQSSEKINEQKRLNAKPFKI
jgi:hypothetical protein